MNDWLKDKPMLAWTLNLLSSILIVLMAFWLTGWSTDNTDEEARFKKLEIEKAPYVYVDDNCAIMNHKLEEHRLIDAETNRIQDAKIETMRKEWRVDQKEILNLIRGMK